MFLVSDFPSLVYTAITVPQTTVEVGTVVPGFSVLGFSVLPGFRALKAGDGAWSVHKTLFGFSAPLFQHLIKVLFEKKLKV